MNVLLGYSAVNGSHFWKEKASVLDMMDTRDSAEGLVTFFQNVIREVDFKDLPVAEIEVLIYIAGYAVFKLARKGGACEACVSWFTTDDKIDARVQGVAYNYISRMDRGALCYPSLDAIAVLQIVYEVRTPNN